jgi:hypothetical protein
MITTYLYDHVIKKWDEEDNKRPLWDNQKAIILLIQEWLDRISTVNDPKVLVLRMSTPRTGKSTLFEFLDRQYSYFVPVVPIDSMIGKHEYSSDFSVIDIFKPGFDTSSIKDKIVIFDDVDVFNPQWYPFNIKNAVKGFLDRGAKGVILVD